MKHIVVFLLAFVLLVNSGCASGTPASSTGRNDPAVAGPIDSFELSPEEQTIPYLQAGVGVPGDGNVIALGAMDTFRYLLAVYRGDPSTFIMRSTEGDYLLAWAMQDNVWGWLGMSRDGSTLRAVSDFIGSNKANTLTFTGLVKTLEDKGWEYIAPAGLPAWFAQQLGSVTSFMIEFGSYMMDFVPVFMVMPGPAGGDGGWDPAYQGPG